MTIITAVSGQPFKNDGGVALNMGDGSTSITNVAHGHTVKSSSYDTNSSFTLPNPSGVDPLGVQNDGMVVRKSTKTNIYNNVNNFIFFGAYGSPLFSENKSYAELDAKDIHRSTDTEFSYFPAFTNRQAPLKRKQTIKLGELMMTSGEQLTQTPIEILDGGTMPFDENRLTLANEDCEGAEENEWIILDKGALGLPTMNINPPCGCYINAGVGLLDLIPLGLAFKAIGKFATFFKYILNTKKTASGPWNTAITYIGGKLTEKMPFGDAVATTVGTIPLAQEWIKGWKNKFFKYIPNYKTGDIGNLPAIPTIETEIAEDLPRIIPHPTKGSTYYSGTVEIQGQPLAKLSRYSTTFIKSVYTRAINEFKTIMGEIRILHDKINQLKANRAKKIILLGYAEVGPANATLTVKIRIPPTHYGIVNDAGDIINYPGGPNSAPAFSITVPHVTVTHPDSIVLAGNVVETENAILLTADGLDNALDSVVQDLSEQYSAQFGAFFHDPGINNDGWREAFKILYGNDLKSMITQKAERFYKQQILSKQDRLKRLSDVAKKKLKAARQELINGDIAMAQLKSEIETDKSIVLEELKGLATKDKITATKSIALNGSLSASWFVITGRAIFQVGRQKRCLGKNTFLNPETCNCECFVGYTECSADYTLNSMWGNIMWTWDTIIPMLPKTEEMTTCFESCCEGQVAYKSTISHLCGCACYGDLGLTQSPLEDGSADSHFKGSEGCDCFSEGWMGFGKARGKCVSDSATALALGQGQAWDDARCEYNCAETRALPLKLGASPDCPDTRLTTNMSGSSYSAFKPGSVCECECSQAASGEGSWPPSCPAGYVFDTRANVCGCMPAGVCKQYAGDANGDSFTGPNAVSDAIQFINDNTANCTSPYVHGYYYSDGDTIVAEVVGRLPEFNEGGDQIGYEVITGYTSEGDCGPGAILAGVPEGVLPNVCKTPQITHNYTWTACPTDGSSCPLTLSDEAFNYTYP